MNETEKGWKRIAHEHQRRVPEEEKDKKRESIRSKYGNMVEEDKQKLKKIRTKQFPVFAK